MADCNIRNIEPALLQSMKACAVAQGLTLRAWVILHWCAAVHDEAASVPTEPPAHFTEEMKTEWKSDKEYLEGDKWPANVSFLEQPAHDPKSCRVYGCLMCKSLKG